jgi:hypothetical protein
MITITYVLFVFYVFTYAPVARHVYGYNKVLAGDADENVKDYYTV